LVAHSGAKNAHLSPNSDQIYINYLVYLTPCLVPLTKDTKILFQYAGRVHRLHDMKKEVLKERSLNI
jgi:hypothetical protein